MQSVAQCAGAVLEEDARGCIMHSSTNKVRNKNSRRSNSEAKRKKPQKMGEGTMSLLAAVSFHASW
jgi:hypothetical protein